MSATYQGKLRIDLAPDEHVWLAPASATVIKAGEFLTWESNLVAIVDDPTDDVYFIGMALGASANGETDKIPITPAFIADVTVASAAYDLGAGLKFAADGSLEADGGADTVAHVWDYSSATVTSLRARFDARAKLAKFLTVSA